MLFVRWVAFIFYCLCKFLLSQQENLVLLHECVCVYLKGLYLNYVSIHRGGGREMMHRKMVT